MPSDVADAVAQDQIADSLVAPIEQEAETAAPGTEVSTETQDDATTVTEQTGAEEEANDWLPTEQEKVFPFETIAKYAERYGYTAEEIQADPRLARTLTERLNQDIYVQQLRQREETPQEQTEDTVEQPEPTRTPTVQEWLQQVNDTAKNYVHPEVAQHFGNQFMKIFGAPEMKPEQASAFGQVLTAGVINVLNSVLPNMLAHPVGENKTFFQQMVEQSYEGFGDNWETSSLDRAWQSVVASDPKYAQLPGLNVKGSSAAREQAAIKLAGSVEDFDAMTFKGKDGKALSAYQTAVKKYGMIAKVMAGEKVTPAEAKTLIEAGRKSAQKDRIQQQAGNLGSGKSNGQIASGSSDDFWKDATAIYNQQHGRL